MAIQITEYSYSSVNGEFVEFTNTGTTAVDMTGYSFDDNSRIAGSFSLSGFGTVKPGESVIITETVDVNAFRTAWGLPATVKVLGGSNIAKVTGGSDQALQRADEINLYDANGALIDRLTYNDDSTTPTGNGAPRTQNVSAYVDPAYVGANKAAQWKLSAVGDMQGSKISVTGGDIGSPGSYIAPATTLAGIDLSKYVRIGRYTLPEVTNANGNMTAAQLASQSAMIAAGSLLAQEVSGITYNPDTDTLFVEGDGGTSVVQVTKTGQLIDSMTLAADATANIALGEVQGRFVSDPEGIAYLGNGQFAITEERASRIDKFTYKANTTLSKTDLYNPTTNPTGLIQKVTVGTVNNNIGLEGITYDPSSNSATNGIGFIGIKEASPEGIFQTNVDFAKGTSTNGSSAAYGTNLFDPTLMGLATLSDVFALSNVAALNGKADSSHLLVLSRQSGKIVNVDRSGNISSSLTITADPGDKLSIPNQSHEGVTVDKNGILYIVSEAGGGDDSAYTTPELWVYAPSATAVIPVNQAPTAVAFGNSVTAIADKTSIAARLKVADIAITDDGLGTNNLTLTGADAAAFEIVSNALYVKAGTAIDFKTKASYSVTVNVDDTTVGATPDLTKVFTLAVTDPNAPIVPPAGNTSALIISEVAPWASGNTAYAADWFEVTNTGTTAVDITGWSMDDNSNVFTSAVPLRGITSIGAGKSVVFIEGTSDGSTDAAIEAAFSTAIFGTATLPTGFLVGHYGGSGVGLSTGGDEVNLFNAAGSRITGIGFGASTTGLSFDNKAGLGSSGTTPAPLVTTLSAVGVNGAFLAKDGVETISVGTIGTVVVAPVNKAPTAVVLSNLISTLAENSSNNARVRVADIAVTDDGLGTNNLSIAGADASAFEIINNALYVKSGTALSYKTKPNYSVSVNVDDPTVGTTPDATKAFTLALTEAPVVARPVAPKVDTAFKHVLVISIDGLHNSDLNAASLQSSLTNIKRLQAQGITYTNAFSAAPSDSFPGELNYITGANPGTTGVLYDKSYTDALYAPGTTLAQITAGTAKPGTVVEYAENVDITWPTGGTLIGFTDGTKAFDISQLPVDSKGNPVYPNQYLRTNTIFDVASAAGLSTAWSDKHPAAYTILTGPSSDPTKFNLATGKVGSINDYYSLEINAAVAIDPTKKGPLPTSTFGALVDKSTGTPFSNTNPNILASFFNDGTKGNAALFAAPPAGTTANQFSSFATTSTYDDYKVKAILNEIDGFDHSGTTVNGTPSIFGLNLQAVSVAQKEPGTLFNGGGFDANGNARPDLISAVNHTDQSIGLILDELKKTGQADSTLVILTAKHGQNPVKDPTVGLSSTFDSVTGKVGGDGELTAFGALLAQNGIQIASERGGDTSSLIFLKNPADVAKAVALLNKKDYSFDTALDKVSDPTGKTTFATETAAAQGTILIGQAIINAGLGDPLTNDRTPDIVIPLNTGYFFGNALKKRSEHGGFTDEDTHVATIVSSPGLANNLQGKIEAQTVSTKQIAVTTLQALGLDASQLQGVQIDGTTALPDLAPVAFLPFGNKVVVGTTGADLNIVPTRNDTIFTDGGNDLVDASVASGGNRIYGGDGNDELLAGKNDRLFGEAGDDILDAVPGMGGNRLYGGAGNDTLYAGTNDFLSGGDGDDKLFAGKGGNTLFGGAGADKFYLTYNGLPTSANTVGDFEVGIDKMLILGVSGVNDFSKVTLTAKGADTLVAAGGKDLALLTGIQSSSLNASSFAFA